MQMIHNKHTTVNNTLIYIYIQWKKNNPKKSQNPWREKTLKKKETKLVTELMLRSKHFSNETRKKKQHEVLSLLYRKAWRFHEGKVEKKKANLSEDHEIMKILWWKKALLLRSINHQQQIKGLAWLQRSVVIVILQASKNFLLIINANHHDYLW